MLQCDTFTSKTCTLSKLIYFVLVIVCLQKILFHLLNIQQVYVIYSREQSVTSE